MPKKPIKQQRKVQKHQEDQTVKHQRRKRNQIQYKRGVAKSLKGYDSHFAEFQQQLHPLGLKMRDVEGDGNCMFRSIADFIDGSENHHLKYRQMAIDEMRLKANFYSLFIEDDQTFDEYLRDMANDGEWGGNLELQALTSQLSINFMLHMKGRPAMILTCDDGLNTTQALKQKKTVHLAYHLVEDVAEHYSSIRLFDDETDGPAEDIPKIIFGNINFKNPDQSQESDNNWKNKSDGKTISNKIYSQEEEEEQEEDTQIIQTQGNKNCASKLKYKNQNPNLNELNELKDSQKNGQDNMNDKESQGGPIQGLNKKCKCGSKISYKKCCFEKQNKVNQNNNKQQYDVKNNGNVIFI